MVKPGTDFAESDFAMARRAQWMLDDRRPGHEQPPLDLDLNRFDKFVRAGGFLEPLAHFGQRRRDDALLAPKQLVDAAAESETSLPVDSPIRRNLALSEACAREKRASDELREAWTLVRNARHQWLRASELRADADSLAGMLVLRHDAVAVLRPTEEHRAILHELSSLDSALGGAIATLEPSLRRIVDGDPFPSTLGLPTAARRAALNDQAVRLFDGGVPLLQIAHNQRPCQSS